MCVSSKEKFLESVEYISRSSMVIDEEAEDHRWVIMVSILVRKIIGLLRTPMEYTGFIVDFLLNLFSANGGFLGLLFGRIDMYKGWNFVEHLESMDLVNSDSSESVRLEPGSSGLMDLCVMASKLAYENAKEDFISFVLFQHYQMHYDFGGGCSIS
ncbi:unnamed protein product [Arabis nemorensis]|uniref:Uncharacterized protein n=1 Tax=Arabis nemorensis TaxID=586526 RepID=A0A565AM46_9BRAS|nr:unnamed protein product [Arabis nemorensis]